MAFHLFFFQVAKISVLYHRFNSVKEKYDQLTAQIEDKKSRLLGAE